MTRFFLCLLFACFHLSILAQKDCPQADYQQQLLRSYPQLRAQYDKIEDFGSRHFAAQAKVSADSNSDQSALKPVPEKIIIPVVVHILWNSSAQNISDAQVLSQIDVLNKDYSGTNADRNKIPSYFSALAADCSISFALAKMDPSGNATNGIVRRQTGVTVFTYDDKAKATATGGDDAWDAGSYLNIWVCNLQGGISGYASPPGGPAAKDGVVISTSAFGTINISGPFNKGRTATHEIGHWLNLRHIWGDANCGDDNVDDTPMQQAANRGCNSGEKFTCGSTAHGDMYMNFMDFSDDACMYMFTKGQRERMRVLFEAGGPRHALLSSNALAGNGLPLQTAVAKKMIDFDLLLYPNPATNNITLQMSNGNAGAKIYICNQIGQVLRIVICTGVLQQLDISNLQPGLYFVKMEGAETNTMKKFVKQ